MCPSPFASFACFTVTLLFTGFIALPLGLFGAGTIAGVALWKKSTKKRWVIVLFSALAVPAAFAGTLVATTLLEKANAGLGLWSLASAIFEVAYVALALRMLLPRKMGSQHNG